MATTTNGMDTTAKRTYDDPPRGETASAQADIGFPFAIECTQTDRGSLPNGVGHHDGTSDSGEGAGPASPASEPRNDTHTGAHAVSDPFTDLTKGKQREVHDDPSEKDVSNKRICSGKAPRGKDDISGTVSPGGADLKGAPAEPR